MTPSAVRLILHGCMQSTLAHKDLHLQLATGGSAAHCRRTRAVSSPSPCHLAAQPPRIASPPAIPAAAAYRAPKSPPRDLAHPPAQWRCTRRAVPASAHLSDLIFLTAANAAAPIAASSTSVLTAPPPPPPAFSARVGQTRPMCVHSMLQTMRRHPSTWQTSSRLHQSGACPRGPLCATVVSTHCASPRPGR